MPVESLAAQFVRKHTRPAKPDTVIPKRVTQAQKDGKIRRQATKAEKEIIGAPSPISESATFKIPRKLVVLPVPEKPDVASIGIFEKHPKGIFSPEHQRDYDAVIQEDIAHFAKYNRDPRSASDPIRREHEATVAELENQRKLTRETEELFKEIEKKLLKRRAVQKHTSNKLAAIRARLEKAEEKPRIERMCMKSLLASKLNQIIQSHNIYTNSLSK